MNTHRLLIVCENVKGFFASPRAHAIERELALLLPAALHIVEEINAVAPNKTVSELNEVAAKYALPTIDALADGQTPGNVALNLGTEILKTARPGTGTMILNTAIQLAVLATHTEPTLASEALRIGESTS